MSDEGLTAWSWQEIKLRVSALHTPGRSQSSGTTGAPGDGDTKRVAEGRTG